MSVPVLNGPPCRVEAGNTAIFTDSFSQYPSSLWSMAFVLNLDGTPTTIAATVSGTGFSVTLPATLKPGIYDFAEYVTETSTGQRTTANTGILEVTPDLSAATPQTTAEGILAAVEAVILKLSGGSQFASVSFNGQSFTKRDMKNLTEQRTYWKAEVLRERQRADAARRNGESGGRVQMSFVGPRCY